MTNSSRYIDDSERHRPVRQLATPAASYTYVDVPRQEAPEANRSLWEYWDILRRRWRSLALIVGGALLLSLLYGLHQTPVYQARTALEIQGFNQDFMNMKNFDPSAPVANDSAESYIQTQIKLLQSRSLLERVVDKLNLHARAQEPSNSPLETVRGWLGMPRSAPIPPRAQFLNAVAEGLTVRSAGQTHIVEVLYESPDPKLAADFSNALANEFITQSQELRWKSAERTGQWLTKQLEDMKAKLEQSQARLQDYASRSGLLITSKEGNVAESKLQQLQDQLSQAQADRVTKQSKFEQASSAQADTLPEIIDDPTLRDYRARLTELRRQLAELSSAFTPEHYKVKRAQAQIAEVQAALQRGRANVVERIRNEYEAAQRREKLLTQAYRGQVGVVSDQSNKSIQYDSLKREVDSSRQIYESLLQRVKEAGVASAMRASNVMIVDPATTPFLPYKPNLTLNTAVGLLGGLFLGFVFVLVRERSDRSIQSPGDASAWLSVPELGVIPSSRIPSVAKVAGKAPLAMAAGRTNGKAADTSACLELATWGRKPSLLAESFRATLTSLMFAGNNGSRPRAIVLTSAGPGEGKTTVTSNLGIAMAEISRRVLVVDADLRQPRMHNIFGLDNSQGMTELLRSEKHVDELPLEEYIQETRISGLYLLPSGGNSASAAHLFHSPRLTELLARLRREFDMVLIDAPPMLQLADARVLGRLADGVVMVLRAGHTTRETAVAARQRFAEDGTLVLGTVLNDWDTKRSASYGAYGYGYGYHTQK